MLGDFRIIREIGRGGMGVVYEAEQISIGRPVALKVLPFASMLDERRLARFRNEIRAAGQLHHTNIVPIYAVGSDRGVHFYAMQLVVGQTLAEVIEQLRAGSMEPVGAASRAALPRMPIRPTQYPLGSRNVLARHRSCRRTLDTARPTAAPLSIAPSPGSAIQAAEALEHAHSLRHRPPRHQAVEFALSVDITLRVMKR